MKTVAFFNNKGGVGKTTLACNFAHFMAETLNQKTLVVDLDPQSNATQLLLDESEWEEIYDNEPASVSKTILTVFSQIFDGDSGINTEVNIHRSPRFGVDVLAGHPSLSRAEDHLSSAWGMLKGEDVGGARKTNWLNTLGKSLSYDLLILDLGPSLGALNRSALIGSTNFVTPVASDLFSLYALENIGVWISGWIAEYENSITRTKKANSDSRRITDLPNYLDIKTGYIGYATQQYVARKSGGEIRSTAAYDKYRRQIPDKAELLKNLSRDSVKKFDLGVIPHMFSMVALAQNVHAPISTLASGQEVRGAQVYQQKRYAEQLKQIFDAMANNLDIS